MPKSVLRNVTRKVMVTLNVIVSLVFLFACLSPYLNPEKWWIIGFTGLATPYVLLLLIFFIIFWLALRPVYALIPLLTMAIGWQQIEVVFAWHPGANFSKRRHDNILRIVDWNVQSFNGMTRNRDAKKQVPNEIAASIMKLAPDVICLQEFNTAENADNIALFSRPYRYHYFSRDYHGALAARYQSGCIIFSKFPIADTGRIAYAVAESLIYADIVKGGDTIRVYTTHLQSFKFKQADYQNIEKIKGQEDEDLSASKSVARKMKLAFSRRGVQANLVRDAIDSSPHPSIICGDFNDVPNSYTYFHIRGARQDAFLKKGFSVGRTFISLAPTLRIDYILPTLQFEVKQFDMVDEDLSDHIMLVADLLIQK